MDSFCDWLRAITLRSATARHQRPNQPADCFLHALPAEILIVVAEYSKLADHWALAQTCVYLRTVLDASLARRFCTWPRPEPEEKINYLLRRARDQLGVYVCERCIAVHRFGTECKSVKSFFHMASFRFSIYTIKHQTLQLALKYTRLGVRGGVQGTALQQILTPRCHQHEPFPGRSGSDYPGTGYQWIDPRVIQGRFMMKTGEVFYPKQQGRLRRDDLAPVVLCQHQQWHPSLLRDAEDRVTHLTTWTPRWWWRGNLPLENRLIDAMNSLLEKQHKGFVLSCHLCPADMELRLSHHPRTRIEYRCWHDFGPEGSPLDVQWRAKQYPRDTEADVVPYYRVPGGSTRVFWNKFR